MPGTSPVCIEFDQDQSHFLHAEYEDSETSYVGEGILGNVHKGTAILAAGHEPVEVALKIPNDEDKVAALVNEHQVMGDLRRRLHAMSANPATIPLVALGEREPDRQRVLVMPFYDNTLLLSTQVRARLDRGAAIEAEHITLQAAIDFSHVLTALHTIQAPRTCVDRKLKDFFLVEEGGWHVVVIDWNVLTDLTPEFLASEFRLQGRLWHELLLETAGVVPFQPYDDQRWQNVTRDERAEGWVSLGLRLILAAVTGTTVDRLQSAQTTEVALIDLRDALMRWQALLLKPVEELEPLEANVARHYAADEQALLGDFVPLSSLEAVAVLRDLLWRKDPTPARLEARQQAIAAVRSHTEAAHERIVDLLQKGETGRAEQFVRTEQEAARAREEYVHWSHLERWTVLFGLLLKSRNRAIRGLREELIGIWRELTSDPSEERLARLRDLLGEALARLDQERLTGRDNVPDVAEVTALEQIGAEVDARLEAIRYRQEKANSGSPQLRRRLDRILELAVQAHYLAPAHVPFEKTLLCSLLDVRAEQRQLEALSQVEYQITQVVGEIKAALTAQDFRRAHAAYSSITLAGERPRALREAVQDQAALLDDIARFGLWASPVHNGAPSLTSVLIRAQALAQSEEAQRLGVAWIPSAIAEQQIAPSLRQIKKAVLSGRWDEMRDTAYRCHASLPVRVFHDIYVNRDLIMGQYAGLIQQALAPEYAMLDELLTDFHALWQFYQRFFKALTGFTLNDLREFSQPITTAAGAAGPNNHLQQLADQLAHMKPVLNWSGVGDLLLEANSPQLKGRVDADVLDLLKVQEETLESLRTFVDNVQRLAAENSQRLAKEMESAVARRQQVLAELQERQRAVDQVERRLQYATFRLNLAHILDAGRHAVDALDFDEAAHQAEELGRLEAMLAQSGDLGEDGRRIGTFKQRCDELEQLNAAWERYRNLSVTAPALAEAKAALLAKNIPYALEGFVEGQTFQSLRANSVARDLANLYWTVREQSFRDQMLDSASLKQTTDQALADVSQIFSAIIRDFTAGRMTEARRQLDRLDDHFQAKNSIVGVLIREVAQLWRNRIAELDTLDRVLSDVETHCASAAYPVTSLADELFEAMQSCPAEVFALRYQRWARLLKQLETIQQKKVKEPPSYLAWYQAAQAKHHQGGRIWHEHAQGERR